MIVLVLPMDSLVRYYTKQLTNYRTWYVLVRKSFDEEDIHQLRLCTKRLKAIFRLAHFADDTFENRVKYATFKEVFLSVGDIRDIDITIRLLDSNGSLKEHHDELVRTLNKTRTELTCNCIHLLPMSLEFASPDITLTSILNAMNKDEVMCFLERIVRKTGKRLAHFNNQKKLHNARKLIKMAMYVSEASSIKTINGQKKIDEYQLLQRHLGTWHDYVIAKKILSYYDLAEKYPNTAGHINETEAALRADIGNTINYNAVP
jgi:CHAD domain-containing protein